MKEPKNKWVLLILQTLTFMFGALSGHVAGAAMGGRALAALSGLGVTGLAFHLVKEEHNTDSKTKRWFGYFSFGFAGGLLTSPTMEVKPSAVQGLTGLQGIAADTKEGAKMGVKNIAQKFYLDKTPLAKFIPGLNGLDAVGNLSEEEAQKIIDEMIKSQSVNGLDGSIADDFNIKGSIADDFGVGAVAELPEEFTGVVGLSDIDEDDLEGVGQVIEEMAY